MIYTVLARMVVIIMIPLKIEVTQHVSFLLGVRFVGFLIVALTMMISLVVMIAQSDMKGVFSSTKELALFGNLIIFFCLMSFLVLKIFYFYLFFEVSLVPIFLIILG
jgi:NADH:ubiquinone oxidoreductase subunit 4 (subunit M)